MVSLLKPQTDVQKNNVSKSDRFPKLKGLACDIIIIGKTIASLSPLVFYDLGMASLLTLKSYIQ